MIFALLSITLNALAQLFMKKSAMSELTPSEMISNINIYAALGSYGLSIILWLVALRDLKLSVAYPLQSLGYVLVTILSVIVLSEKINHWNVLGLALICSGAITLAVNS